MKYFIRETYDKRTFYNALNSIDSSLYNQNSYTIEHTRCPVDMENFITYGFNENKKLCFISVRIYKYIFRWYKTKKIGNLFKTFYNNKTN